MGNAQKKLVAREFFNTMSSWRTPDILINPIGTMIYHKNGQWMEGPWVLAFSRAVASIFLAAIRPAHHVVPSNAPR